MTDVLKWLAEEAQAHQRRTTALLCFIARVKRCLERNPITSARAACEIEELFLALPEEMDSPTLAHYQELLERIRKGKQVGKEGTP